MDVLVVLGVQDPEMDAIEQPAIAAGLPVAYASTMEPSPGAAGGDPAYREPRRVIPPTAYRSDALLMADGSHRPEQPGRIIAVECAPTAGGWGTPEWWYARRCRLLSDPLPLGGIPAWSVWSGGGAPEVITIDHHHPGDAGFGRPPSEFLPASSIGQFMAWLASEGLPLPGTPLPPVGNDPGVSPGSFGTLGAGGSGTDWFVASRGGEHYEVPLELVLTAAADHCLAAAYAGQCYGVDPGELRRYRVEQVLTRTDGFGRPASRTAGEVERDILVTERVLSHLVDQARQACEPVGWLDIGGHQVLDVRGVTGLRDLPEVACVHGLAYLADAPGRPGERPKVVLGGCGAGTVPGKAPVEAFVGRWAEENGLIDPYGDPARGFAGAYLLPQ